MKETIQDKLKKREGLIKEFLEFSQKNTVWLVEQVQKIENEIYLEKVISGKLSEEGVKVEICELYELLGHVSKLLRQANIK